MMTATRILGTFRSLQELPPYRMTYLDALLDGGAIRGSLLPVKRAYIHRRGGNFEFDQHAPGPDALEMYAFLSFDLHGELNDIVAWDPVTGDLRAWLGAAWAWGEGSLLRPCLGPEMVPVWRSPLSRIRAGLDGLVLIRSSALAYQTLGVPMLLAEDAAHREELRQHLTRALPRILIPSEVRA